MNARAFVFTLSMGLSSSSVAFGEETVFEKYEKIAQSLAEQVSGQDPNLDLVEINAKNDQLLSLGSEIMDLYALKFSECADQYSDFKSKFQKLPSMSPEEIHAKYHDGEDLPSAPQFCYLGRSLVVHPAMSAARMIDGSISANDKESILEESLEVASHVRRVAKKLSN